MNRDFIRRRFLIVFVSLLLTIVGSSEIAAQNGPTQGDATYNYGGTWILHQDGLGPITMEIQRIGSEITGRASYDAGRKGIARGTVQGRAWSETYPPVLWAGPITINHFEVEIRWNDAVGVYHGTNMEKIPPRNSYEAELCGPGSSIRFDSGCAALIPLNSLAGEGWSKAAPAVIVRWHTDPVFRPLPPPVRSAPPTPPPPPPPIKSSGKMPKSEPAAPPKPPFITTGQIIVQPYVPMASVYLGWDGGPDHPNAEVMAVNEDGQTLMFQELFKKPKGALELRLQRGRQYMYVLRDNGVTLSTVNLVVP